jgi:hypothetical protein
MICLVASTVLRLNEMVVLPLVPVTAKYERAVLG